MVFYYLLHIMSGNKQNNETDGKKNARTFIIGSIFYIILYMIVMHYSLRYSHIAGILKTGLIMLFGVDIATMGYLYKSYYGRNIINEINDNDEDWKYIENSHKYKKKTDEDIVLENEIEKIKNNYNIKKINELREKLGKN